MNRLFLLLFGMVTLVAHAQVPDYVPTDGLVAWYPLNGNANDESGNGYDGVIHGASASENRLGIANSSLSFDGFDDFISVSNDFNFEELTLSVWIKQHQAAEPYSAIIDRSLTNNIGWWIEDNSLVSATIQFAGGVASGDYFSTQAERPQLNVWTHISAVYSQGNQELFINGELMDYDTNSSTLQFPEALMYIGKRTNSAFWDGCIDDVALWNRALTEEEILALYNAPAPAPGCTDSTACNFDSEATSDDGSCIPSGCMEAEACNYNALAECEGEACDYNCCPGSGCCGEGMYWDYELEQCQIFETCQEDLDGDGVIGVNDLMQLLSSFGTMCEEPETGEFTCGDPMNYQGYDYATVLIGEQCWFAENLRAENYRDGTPVIASNVNSNASEFGLLYRGAVVLNEQPICPSQWAVSSDEDWLELEQFVGADVQETLTLGYSDERLLGWGDHLKPGPNSVGFNALFGGYVDGASATSVTDVGLNGQWWTSSLSGVDLIYRNVWIATTGISRVAQPTEIYGFSVRCLKD